MNSNLLPAGFVSSIFGIVLALCSQPILAAPVQHKHALRPVTIARNARSGNIVYLQLDIAEALHYFEDEGLSPRFRYYKGGPNVASALLAGDAEFSGNSIDHAMALQDGPNHLKMVASFTSLPAVSLLVRRPLRAEIRSVADLKGHRIGISDLGSGTHIIANAILESAGLHEDSVKFVVIDARDSFINPVKAGDVDAVVTTDPIAIRLLIDANCSLLLDLVTPDETQRVFHGGYQFTGLLTRSDTIAKDPELVQKMVNIIVRANRYISTHSATDIASILPPSTVGDRFLFIKSLQHTRPSFSRDGDVRPEDVANSVRAYESFAGHLVMLTAFDDRFAKQAIAHANTER